MLSRLSLRVLTVVFVAALLAAGGRAFAQPLSSPMLQTPGSACYVWGQVRAPGAYSFVANPDILELLSAGGGPTENANLANVILIRAESQQQSNINLRRMLASGQVVRLAPGDVVIVPSSTWYRVRDWLSVVTVASTLATLAVTILYKVGA